MTRKTATESLTARMDNAGLDPALLGAARALLAQPIDAWEIAGPKEQLLLRGRKELSGLGDRVLAVAHLPGSAAWILQNDWSGFPDPSEFVLVGFRRQGEIHALGFFEDWPACWSVPPELKAELGAGSKE